MRSTIVLLVIFFLALSLVSVVDAKRSRGRITTKDTWVYIDKFCYDSNGLGYLNWTIDSTYARPGTNLKLLFYDDQDYSWPKIYGNRDKMSCSELFSYAKGNRTIISGEAHSQPFSDPYSPHFWYFVVSNCGGNGIEDLEYDFLMVNAENGGPWTVQFSFDEQGLPEMYLFYWLLFFCLVVVHLVSVWRLHQQGQNHAVVRLVSLSIVIEFFSLFFLFIHYIIYAGNGVGAPGMKGFGDILDMIAQMLLIFVLILLGKGWAISKPHLDQRKILIVLMSLFFLLYLIMYIVQAVATDPASSLYIYETVPGILLLVLRVATFGWFIFELMKNYRAEIDQAKRSFYLIFGGVFSVWFLMLPFIVLIAIGIPAPWRYKTVQGMYLTINTIAWSVFVWLLWPSRAQNYFSQIGKTDLLLGKSSSPYETL